ncbi:MAG: signal peptidase II [Treponema sp.]|jgi:signal peptidase II|nr:signal peptidase II [Treponema sp.]
MVNQSLKEKMLSLKEKLLSLKGKFLPLSLTAFVILADQIVKMIIVKAKPEYGLIKDVFNNGFIWIYHVRNKAIAFSLGDNLPEVIKPFIFVVVPLLVLGFLLWYYFKSNEFSKLQRWAAAGIIGGGLGNIIDRIFRIDGVVDFISVNLYGLLGMSRWPTFNIADSSVVVSCILLFITMFVPLKKTEKPQITEEKKVIEDRTNE